MEEITRENEWLQWHPAFYAGIQVELYWEARRLRFENEHQLGTKPKEIDVLIIKKNPNVPIEKNIGQIFRTHNIVEYKSPEDYLSIDDYYKVYAYACFYKADAPSVDAVKASEITITFVCRNYPYSMMEHLKKELKNLTNDIKDPTTVTRIIAEYTKHRGNNLYRSLMDIIVRANKEMFKEEKDMLESLKELFEDEYNRREAEFQKKMSWAEQRTQQAEQRTQQAEQRTQQAEQRTQQAEQKAQQIEQNMQMRARKSIRKLVNDFKVSAEQAMDILEIPLEERSLYV